MARESRVLLPFDGNLSDFEGVVECWHLGEYVLDGRLCYAVSFRELLESSGFCKLSSSEHQLPVVKLLVV